MPENYEEMYNLDCFTPEDQQQNDGETLATEIQTLITAFNQSNKPKINCIGLCREDLAILIFQRFDIQVLIYLAFSRFEIPEENVILCTCYGNGTIANIVNYDTKLPFIPICVIE